MPVVELAEGESQLSPPKPVGAVRVLHLVNGEYFAGAERVQDLLALNLPTFGYEVGFVCVKPDRFPRFRQSREAALWEVPVRHPADRRGMRRIADIARQESLGWSILTRRGPPGRPGRAGGRVFLWCTRFMT